MIGEDGLRGAGGETTRACAAVIGDDGFVGFEFDAEQDFSQEKCGAYFGVYEQGIFSDPAETCALREITFEDGTCVCIKTVGDGMTELFFDEAYNFL